MALPSLVGEFRVVDEVALRFTPNGKAVANFRVAANSRKQNEAGEWVDDKVCFLNATAWAPFAEHIAESVAKGDLVVIRGRIETRNYEDKEGNKRTSFDLNVDDIGPSLRWNDVSIQRAERAGGQATRSSSPAGDDPWAAPQQDTAPPF